MIKIFFAILFFSFSSGAYADSSTRLLTVDVVYGEIMSHFELSKNVNSIALKFTNTRTSEIRSTISEKSWNFILSLLTESSLANTQKDTRICSRSYIQFVYLTQNEVKTIKFCQEPSTPESVQATRIVNLLVHLL